MPGAALAGSGMNPPLGRKLRAAMAGGGPRSFIGPKHAEALALTLRAELVCGAFSDVPEESPEAAKLYGVDPARGYLTYEEMLKAEMGREDKPDFVILAVPNKFHAPFAKAALEAGLHVYCEKPMCMTVAEARELVDLAAQRNLVLAVAHNYVGYPCAILARDMIARGDIGGIVWCRGEYLQGWLANPQIEFDASIPGHYQAKWRLDPEFSGGSCCFGDIGTHVFDTLGFMLDRVAYSVSAKLSKIPNTRKLDTHGEADVDFGGIPAHILASQISAGYENQLVVEIVGNEGSLRWAQEQPNQLWHNRPGRGWACLTPNGGASYASPEHGAACPWPPGHPAGLTNAWAYLYGRAMDDMVNALTGQEWGKNPTYRNGVNGLAEMAFLEAVLESNANSGNWVNLQE